MARSKNTFELVPVPNGEVIVTEWSKEMIKQTADNIARDVESRDMAFTTLSEYGDPNGFVDVIEREDITYGGKAKSPKGHRYACGIKVQAFGKSKADLNKLLMKSVRQSGVR